MKVLVCGGRDYRNAAHVWRTLDQIHEQQQIKALMQGGAPGADRFARDWAATKPSIARYVCHAEWEKYGRAAGPIRNARMLGWEPDVVVAFPGGIGTADMVAKATAAGIRVIDLRN